MPWVIHCLFDPVGGLFSLGWRVTVVDRRGTHATGERFAQADDVVICAADEAGAHVRLDARTAAVVMTHHYADDLHFLDAALRSNATYVGLLGPARRKERLLADLSEQEHFTPTPEQLARLHGPVGLDIGAMNPAEIAAAVIAEIVAARSRRRGGPLRDRAAPIHEKVLEVGELS